jgi:cholinesterase
MGEEEIPGNAGVKDTVLALRWIRDNISAFKGNPYKVVVSGQGFGAAMVEALILSPMAQGLFHGAILQSGSILCPWSFNYDARERGQRLNELINEDSAASFDLSKVEINELSQKSNKIAFPYYPFGICVEKAFKGQERLLSETPDEIMSNNNLRKVPVIIGYNNNEAYVFVSIIRQYEVLQKSRKDLSMLLPDELRFLNAIELNQVMEQIKELYFKNNFTMAALLAFHR